jgi:penicillin-binding protein 2
MQGGDSEPQIAVAVLLFQGGTGGYAGPVAREIIGKYLDLNKTYTDYNLDTVVTQ